MSREYMTPGFAVFNGHVNDADKRARAALKKMSPEWFDRLVEIEKEGNGIMHIFNVDIEPATAAYAALVTFIVNGEHVIDGEETER